MTTATVTYRWAAWEADLLRSEYTARGAAPVCAATGRKRRAVVVKARELGVPPPRVWTPERDRVLRVVYPRDGVVAAAAALGVTRSAVKNRVQQLGLRRPQKWWTPEEDAVVRAEYGAGEAAARIAAKLGRGVPAVKKRARELGVTSGRMYSAAEVEAVRTRYAADGATALARELLGSDDELSVWRVYNLAARLGVTNPVRHPPEVFARVRDLHARGLNDRQIAAAMADYFPGRNDRERVTAIRHRLGLPANKPTAEEQRERGRRTRAAQMAAGVNPRDRAFARLATRYGLPPDTPPRAVEILLALAGGPKNLDELEAAGCKPRLTWNALPSTYVAGLVRRGLVARLPLPTNRGPRAVYSLTAAAMDLLAKGGDHAAGQG